MRENILGTAVSIFAHLCIIFPLLALSYGTNGRTSVKAIEVDFSLVKEQKQEVSINKVKEEKAAQGRRFIAKKEKAEKHIDAEKSGIKGHESAPAKDQTPPRSVPTVVSASDVRGIIAVHGTPATYAGSRGNTEFAGLHGDTTGGERGGVGSTEGRGGEGLTGGGEDYNFIRDAVLKNIRYPDRARRLGLEGKVTLSFVVLESGATSDVRVISSSGHRILDENAKEAAASTRVSVKTFRRVAVKLPITYKLQSQESSRQ